MARQLGFGVGNTNGIRNFSGKEAAVIAPPHTAEATDWLYRHDRRYLPTVATVGVPAAEFRWITDGIFPVQLWDSSVGPSSWLWNFDGYGTSTTQNPVVDLYSFAGATTYTVTLTINGEPSLSAIHMITITE